MIYKKNHKVSKKVRVLVIPLDWGLGHATRCIPIINELIANNCDVFIAAENATKSLLQREFQQLTFIPVKGYRISYSAKRRWLPLKIITQIPRLLFSIYKEHGWSKKVVKKHSIDVIISDNRFGLYHSGIPCVYITHQLQIKTGNTFSDTIARKIHFWFIKKYSFCWVPDFEGNENVAGQLSHPLHRPRNVNFIGSLSRFEKTTGVGKKYALLIILSGPEPQRSIFESLLLPQLQNFTGKSMLVRGLPGFNENKGEMPDKVAQNLGLVIKNHLSSNEMNEAIQQAELVISRSGYTTIMDLMKLGQKAILVPTPGQTEQEYLAMHLMKQQFYFTTQQEGFILTDALQQAALFPFVTPAFNMEQYKKVVYDFVQSL